MTDVLAPALYALFIWWFGTGAVLLLDRLSRMTRRMAMIIATLGALAAIAGINATQDTRTLTAAVCAFSCAIVLWGWHELSFLSGVLTGPRRTPCPKGATGWRRFVYAAQTLIHHEIAIALSGIVLALWLWDAANPVALMTFGVLWVMRLSAKLNLFLGAPNVAVEFLPGDLGYLTTYFSQRPMNGLFPVSVTVGTLASAWCFAQAATPLGDVFAVSVYALDGMLIALGTLEHWFLVLPYREAALWRWYMQARGSGPVSSQPRAPSGTRRANAALDHLTPPGASALPGR
jgi:putative photosynthetic complex assembly protein 2